MMSAEDRAVIEPEFNRALRLRDDGDLFGAAAIFERLDAQHPNQPAILGDTTAVTSSHLIISALM